MRTIDRKRAVLAVLLLASCTCGGNGETGAVDSGRFIEVRSASASGYIVPEYAARAAGHPRVWTPSEEDALAFEHDLAKLDANVDGYSRQYLGIFVEKEERAMEVRLYCRSVTTDYRLDSVVPTIFDGCVRYALYFPESRRLKLEHYFLPGVGP